jgi:hypothetical protein
VGDITILGWIKPYSAGEIGNGRILNNNKLTLWQDGNKRMNLWSDGSTAVSSFNTILDWHLWNFITVTRDQYGVTNFYVNGVISGTANQNSGVPVAGSTHFTLSLGAICFDGLMSDIRILSGLLSVDEMFRMYTDEKRRYIYE